MNKNINIIEELDGQKVVLIHDIRFKSRRMIDWDMIEKYLKEYIGECYEIIDTSEKIYIGTDFPDEFSHSKDTELLKGANEKAKLGWYRYDTRFGIPVYDEEGQLLRYNIFHARMLVRCDKEENLYLYDFVRIKKETSDPLEQ